MLIGQTIVNGTATINLEFLPEFIIIGDPLDNTANLLPSALQVNVSGVNTIELQSTALIKAFAARMGNLSEKGTGLATGAVRRGKVYRLAYGGATQARTQIQITQPAGGAAQQVYGFSTYKDGRVCVRAAQTQVNAQSSLMFDSFDDLVVDGSIANAQVTFTSGWTEQVVESEIKALNTMMKALDPDLTMGDLPLYFPNGSGNGDRVYQSVRIFTGANARNVLRIGKITTSGVRV